MLDETKRQAIVDSFRLVVPIADTAADLFYQRLFELRPAYRKLFSGDISRQKKKLITMLAFIVRSLNYRDAQWAEKVTENDDLFYVVLAMGSGILSCTRSQVTRSLRWVKRCCGHLSKGSGRLSHPQ